MYVQHRLVYRLVAKMRVTVSSVTLHKVQEQAMRDLFVLSFNSWN